jgi:exodeoxyribonuclease-5
MIDLSEEQRAAVDSVAEWLSSGLRQTFVLGGYAGTGKTTIIKEILNLGRGTDEGSHTMNLAEGVAVCAPTGKAASVLRSKGVPATTVHRLIYEAEGNPPRFRKVRHIGCHLVVVDEASMLSSALVSDLESFGKKVLYVGDHGQLEPVGDDPEIMRHLDARLETIHRQASGSPIIRFAHDLRVNVSPVSSSHASAGTSVEVLRRIPERVCDYDVVLCGFNNTRIAVNAKVRRQLGFSGPRPGLGERVICLQNSYELGVWNGMMGSVTDVGADTINFVADDGTPYTDVRVNWEQFGAPKKLDDYRRSVGLFDFGYCLTTHKAQGSEWDRVLVLDQVADMWSASRWRYTAATRAARKLTWVAR